MKNYNSFDISNVELLEEGFSNQTGTALTPEQKKDAIELAARGTALLLGKLSQKKKSEYAQELKSRCGRKPLLGKKKKRKYAECQAQFNKTVAEREKIKDIESAPTTEPAPTRESFKLPPIAIGGIIVTIGLLAYLGYRMGQRA